MSGSREVKIDPVIYKKAISDGSYLMEAIDGISPEKKKMEERELFIPLLIELSIKNPELLYGKWEIFMDYLKSDNGFSQYAALYVIANLTKIDRENKFERDFQDYFAQLDCGSVMVASHIAINAAVIAEFKPGLIPDIIGALLEIEKTNQTQSRKNLIKAYVIEAFEKLYPKALNKEEIARFVKKGLESGSPKTRKTADQFLKKYKIY